MTWTKRIEYTMWPVGQGLFTQMDIWVSTKRARVIYDCGTLNYSPKVTEMAMASLRNSDVDLLVISHFHFDHISRIPELLKNVKSVKEVWIPYLTPNQRLLFAFSSAVDGILSGNSISDITEISTLIASGRGWFESRGISTVELGNPDFINREDNPEEEPPDDDDEEPGPPDSLKFESIQLYSDAFDQHSDFMAYKSRLKAIRSKHPHAEVPVELVTWLRPLDDSDTHVLMSDMANWFARNGIPLSPDDLKSNKNSEINKVKLISLIDTLGNTVSRSELRKIYKRLNKDLNTNSIFLLAQPTHSDSYFKVSLPKLDWNSYLMHPSRCLPSFLWTGDAPRLLLREFLKDAKDEFKERMESLFIHQFPHHGSHGSWEEEWFRFLDKVRSRIYHRYRDEYHFDLPINLISAGKSNTFGHPSPDVLWELKNHSIIHEGSGIYEVSLIWR